jgi:hypothetical protein
MIITSARIAGITSRVRVGAMQWGIAAEAAVGQKSLQGHEDRSIDARRRSYADATAGRPIKHPLRQFELQ